MTSRLDTPSRPAQLSAAGELLASAAISGTLTPQTIAAAQQLAKAEKAARRRSAERQASPKRREIQKLLAHQSDASRLDRIRSSE
jgi:hypothetical protein